MKISILNLFNQLKIHLILMSILSIIILLLNTSQNQSGFILKSLYMHQDMAEKLNMLQENDSELSMIEFDVLSNRIQFSSSDIDKALYFDLLDRFFLDVDYQKEQINLLESRSLQYRSAIKNSLGSEAKLTDKNIEMLQTQLKSSLFELIKFHNHILFQKDAFMSYLLYFTAFYIILLTIIYYSKIAKSTQDFEAINTLQQDYEYKTTELSQVFVSASKALKAKQAEIYLDPLTKLNNFKGLLTRYANKQIPSNYSYCIYVFSIDGYAFIKEKISKENSQSILKKVAFIVSLYEKGNDYVARIGFDEFVLILPRSNKEDAFKECEQLRKTIEETSFNFRGIDLKHITVSGVYIIKPKDKTLEETMKYGTHFLKTSKKREVNKTFKVLGF